MTDQLERDFYPGCLILQATPWMYGQGTLKVSWRHFKVLDVTLGGRHDGSPFAGSLKVRDYKTGSVSVISGDNCVIVGDEPLDFADRYEWMTGL